MCLRYLQRQLAFLSPLLHILGLSCLCRICVLLWWWCEGLNHWDSNGSELACSQTDRSRRVPRGMSCMDRLHHSKLHPNKCRMEQVWWYLSQSCTSDRSAGKWHRRRWMHPAGWIVERLHLLHRIVWSPYSKWTRCSIRDPGSDQMLWHIRLLNLRSRQTFLGLRFRPKRWVGWIWGWIFVDRTWCRHCCLCGWWNRIHQSRLLNLHSMHQMWQCKEWHHHHRLPPWLSLAWVFLMRWWCTTLLHSLPLVQSVEESRLPLLVWCSYLHDTYWMWHRRSEQRLLFRRQCE